MMIPKPPPRKQRKAKNNPPPKERHYCEVCGLFTWCQTHETYQGIRRQTSIKMGFQKKLCNDCHDDIQKNRLPHIVDKWKSETQTQYEAIHGEEAWMKLMGKSYKEDICER